MKNLPAFPTDAYVLDEIDHAGLSKREYFAAMALQGLLASWPREGDWPYPSNANVADSAVAIADALIEALEV